MIELENVSIRQNAFRLDGVSFTVPEGQYAALMGRTGSGKTTLAEAICGLRPLAGGRIRLAGRDVTGLKPAARGVGYVPQDAGLFSTLSVRGHLAFALVIRRRPQAEIDARVEELAELLGITHLLERKPAGLSGGEAQRVALGRALAMRPRVLVFDEPLSALDDDTRSEIYDLLVDVRRQAPITVLHITHNRAEAERLADRILAIRSGQVRAVITSDEA